MRRILKLIEGDKVPEGAKYLYSEPLVVDTRIETFEREGLFITRTYQREVPIYKTFHYYEVAITNKDKT